MPRLLRVLVPLAAVVVVAAVVSLVLVALPDDEPAGPAAPTAAPGDTPTTEATPTSPSATPSTEPTPALPALGPPVGFGAGTRGGADGPVRWVTTLDDSGPGTLRARLRQPGPAHVRFTPGLAGTLTLASPVQVPSRVTIDGRGADIAITTHGLVLDGVEDVVVTGLTFDFAQSWEDYLGNAAVLVWGRSEKVWIHHNTFVGAGLGQLDQALLFIDGARDITVSWNLFDRWDKVILTARDALHPSAAADRVTIHHNWYRQTHQRNPLVRFGRVHSFNNWLDRWGTEESGVGMQVSAGGELFSEADVFEGAHPQPAILSREGVSEQLPGPAARGFARERGSRFINVAASHVSLYRPNLVFDPEDFYAYEVDPPDEVLLRALQENAGRQDVVLAGVG